MPQLVDVEGIGQVEFPDHYTPAMIQDYWKQNFQPRLQQEQRIQAGLEASRRPEDTPNWDALKSTARQMVADPAIDIARGVVGVPETAVGLLDIPTMGYTGKALENIPYGPRFGETKQILGELYSPERKAAMEKVKEAKGFAPTIEAMVENPSTLVGTTLESLPSMFGGGALAQKGLSTLAKLGPRAAAFAAGETAPVVAGALGEGLVSAGQTAEQIREETPNRALTWDQAGLALASGALTGGIGVAAGKLAQKLGIENLHTLMAKGKSSTTAKDLGERIVKGIGGAITEGFFEELPQSTQEQIAQNIALGKPWDEGVGEQAAAGLLAGAAMGGVAGAFGPGHHAPAGPQTPPPTAGPQAPAGPAPTTPSAPSAPITPPAPVPVTPLPQLPGMVLNTPIQNWTNPQARTSQHLLAVEPDAFSVGQAAVTTSPAGIFGVDQNGKDVRIPFGTPVTVVARTGPNYDGNPNSTASVLTANGVTAHIASNVLAPLEHFQQAQEQIAAAKGKPFEFTGKAPKSTPIQVTAPEPSGEPVKRTTPLSEAEKLVEQIAEARRKGDRATAVELSKRLDFLGAPKAEASMVAPQQAPFGIQRGPVVTPEIAAAAQQAVSGPSKSDLRLAAETNQQLNARVPVAGRGKAIAERMAAALRIAATIQPGDIINGDAEDRLVVKEALGDGSFWVEGENGNEFEFKFLPGHTVEKRGGIPELKRVENAREMIQGMRRLSLTNPKAAAQPEVISTAPAAPADREAQYEASTAKFSAALRAERSAYEQEVSKRPVEQQPPRLWYENEAAKRGIGPNELTGDEIRAYRQQWDNAVKAALAAGRPVYATLSDKPPKKGWVKRGEIWYPPERAQTSEKRLSLTNPQGKVEPVKPTTQAEPATPTAEPEYTVGSGVPYAGRIYRVLSVKGDKVHIQDSAVGGEKRWVSKAQLKLAQEMSRQQMPEEAPDELPIAPAQQFGRGDGFYITQKGLDIGEGPFNSRDEAAQFAESEVGGRVKIVEVVKGKLTGGPKRATVGRMIEATPATSLATEMPSWEKTLEEKHALEQELKRRAMIFQHDAKQEAARFLGLPEDSLLGMSYAAWSDLSEKLNTLYNKASAEYNGPSNTTNGKVWSDYAKAHPEEVKAIKDSIKPSPAPPEAKTPWYEQHGEDAKQRIFAEMRRIQERIDAAGASERSLRAPQGSISAGAAGFDEFMRAESQAEVLRSIRRGETPEQAAESALKWARDAVAIHNSKRPKDINWKRDRDFGNTYILRAVRDIKDASVPPAEIRPQSVAQETAPKTEERSDEGNLGRFLKIFSDPLSVGDMAVSSDKSIRQNQRSILEKLYPDYKPTRHDAFVERYNYQLGQARLAVYEQNRGISQKEAVAPIPASQLTPAQRATAEGQKKMASEAASVATVLLLNEKVRQKSPSEAWDAKQIHAATGNQSMLNSIRDDLLPIYNRLYAKVAPEVAAPVTTPEEKPTTPPQKPPAEMTASEINKRLDRLAKQSEQITDEFISAGRGSERPSDYLKKNDPLSVRAQEVAKEISSLRNEIELRYGPNAPSRLPTRGFPPRAKASPQTITGSNVQTGTEMPVPPSAAPLTQGREAGGEPTAIDKSKSEQMTPEVGDHVYLKTGDARITRVLERVDTIGGKRLALLRGLRDYVNFDDLLVDAKERAKRQAGEQAKASKRASEEAIEQKELSAIREPSATLTPSQMLEGSSSKWNEQEMERWKYLRRESHIKVINEDIANNLPVSAAAVDAYNIKLPPGYVREGDLYVWRGEGSTPTTQGREAGVEAEWSYPPTGHTRSEQQRESLAKTAAKLTALTLPKELSGAKPRYGYQNLQFNLRFESDADKAAYIATSSNRSASKAAYQDVVRKIIGVGGEATLGDEIRNRIKQIVQNVDISSLPVESGAYVLSVPPVSAPFIAARAAMPSLSADAAIKAIDELQKKIKGKQFSDPFFSTVWGPFALNVAKYLLRMGRPLEVAIREAVEKVRQQFPASNIDPQQAEKAIQTELATENEVLNAAERTKINRLEVDAAAEAIPHMASQQYADLESGYGTLEQAAFEKQQFRKAKSDLATLVNLADGAIRKLPDDRRHPDLYPKVTDGVSVTNGRVTVDDTFSNKLAALGVQHNPDNVKAMQAELYFEQLARKASDARERLQDLQDRLAYYQKIKAPDADIKRLQDLIAQNTTAASNAEAVVLNRLQDLRDLLVVYQNKRSNNTPTDPKRLAALDDRIKGLQDLIKSTENLPDQVKTVGERTNELQQAEAKRMEAQAKVDALHIGPVAEFFGAGIAKLRNLFEKAKASAALIEELRKTTTDPEKLKALADEYRRYGDLPITIEKAIAEDSPLNQRQQDAAAAELQKALAEFNDARDEMNALLQQEEHTIIQQIEEAQKSFSKSANSVQENEALVQSALNAAKGDPALAHSVLAAAEINSLLNNVTAIANLAKHLGENLTQNRWLYDFLSGWRSSPGGSVTFSNLDAASLNVSPEVLQKVIDVASSSPSFASSIVALADAAAAAKAASVPIQLAGTLPSISDALKQGGKKGIDTAAQIASQFSRAVNPAITASRADNRQAARQINSLLTRLMALHHGANLFNNLAQSPQFQTLRQNIIVGSGGAPQQMIDRRPTGFTFREFGEAGKTPAHGEVILNVSEDPSSMERARKKMFAWFSAAEKYVAAYDQAVWLHALDPKTSKSPAELGFNESVARGLAAEIDVGRGEFLDQTFNRLKTTDSARKLMKLPLFRQHDAASRMVGGLVGAAMRSSLGRWVQGMMDSKRVMARFEDLPDLTSKALHSHYDPKNPKDNSYLNYDTYRKQVWNPMAHEGRKFDSDLKVGFQLPTGAIVTKEDIALLERSLVLNGMQRTEVSETNPLRGVHVTVGGKTYIRPSSSVGVFGMDRHLNRNANAFVADSTVAYRDTPGFDSSTDLSSASSNPVVQFWNNRNQMLIDHVVDSDRTDRKMKLDPAMQDAEKRLAALWKAGLETKPSNLAELVSQLATTLNPMAGVNPVSYVTERLNSELLNYQKEAARIQQERNDESTKNTGLKIALSADNEFTKPAAQLELPSSLYDYGALTPGERIARQSSANHQNLVEYANSVRRAIEELQTRLKRYNDGKLSAKEAAENYGGNVSEMKDTLEILRAILKDFEAAFSVNDPSLAPTRLASEISKWAVSGVLALPTVNFRNMTGGQFLVYLSDIAMGITLNRLALWNAVAKMPKGLARLAYVWANGTAKFVDKNLVRHGNALEKVVDVVADAALAPARMALKNPAISTAGWKAQLEQVKNLGYDTKQGWIDAMKAAWLQSALFTNREEQEWAARNPKLAAANRAALTAAKTINAFFGSIGVENSDQVLNSLNLASAAALEQRLTEVARQYGKRLEDSGHTVFDPSDPAFQLKPSEWTTGGNEQARDDALANARLLFQTSASAEGFQLEHALWKFYQDEKAGRPASIYTDRQREAVTRTLLAMMNASLPTNRASVGAGNPLWRSVLTLQGYPADAMMKLINVSFGGTRDRRVAATIGAKLPMLFGIAAMMVLAGAAADGASEYWKRRMQAIQSAQSGVLDKDFWENKDKMASGVGRFLASNMFYLGDFILGMQNQVQGGKGFDPASRVFLVSVVNALTQAVRESYATYSGAGPASHVVQPFIDFAARLTPGANEMRKIFGVNTLLQQSKNVSGAEERTLGIERPKTGAAPSAGPTTVARRFLASAVGEMEEARRKNDQVAYQKAFTKAQEEIGYLQEYYVKHRTELGDSPADAEKHAKQAVWRDYQEINPVIASMGGRRPTEAEYRSITSGPTGERAEVQQKGIEAWQAGAQALFGKTGATTKEEVASSRGGGVPANLSVPATGGGGGGGSTGTISTGRGAPSRLRSVRLGRLALRPHQPQKGRLSLSSAGSRLPRPRATTFKRLSLSTHIAPLQP